MQILLGRDFLNLFNITLTQNCNSDEVIKPLVSSIMTRCCYFAHDSTNPGDLNDNVKEKHVDKTYEECWSKPADYIINRVVHKPHKDNELPDVFAIEIDTEAPNVDSSKFQIDSVLR